MELLKATLAQVIALNSADYTAWEWLWRCTRLLGVSDPEVATQEQHVLAEVAADSPKNYQLWNYRKRLALHDGPSCAQEASRTQSLYAEMSILALNSAQQSSAQEQHVLV